MNERIKEFAEQATKETSMFFADRIDRVHRAEFMEVYNKKFAELVWKDGYKEGAMCMANAIANQTNEQPFGVI